jgi:hypothetical protein
MRPDAYQPMGDARSTMRAKKDAPMGAIRSLKS